MENRETNTSPSTHNHICHIVVTFYYIFYFSRRITNGFRDAGKHQKWDGSAFLQGVPHFSYYLAHFKLHHLRNGSKQKVLIIYQYIKACFGIKNFLLTPKVINDAENGKPRRWSVPNTKRSGLF